MKKLFLIILLLFTYMPISYAALITYDIYFTGNVSGDLFNITELTAGEDIGDIVINTDYDSESDLYFTYTSYTQLTFTFGSTTFTDYDNTLSQQSDPGFTFFAERYTDTDPDILFVSYMNGTIHDYTNNYFGEYRLTGGDLFTAIEHDSNATPTGDYISGSIVFVTQDINVPEPPSFFLALLGFILAWKQMHKTNKPQ